jgi:hypothetical protein
VHEAHEPSWESRHILVCHGVVILRTAQNVHILNGPSITIAIIACLLLLLPGSYACYSAMQNSHQGVGFVKHSPTLLHRPEKNNAFHSERKRPSRKLELWCRRVRSKLAVVSEYDHLLRRRTRGVDMNLYAVYIPILSRELHVPRCR